MVDYIARLSAEVDLNTILIVMGWLIGGIVVVVGMRSQIQQQAHETRRLADEIGLLRQALVIITGRIDTHERDIAYLRGLDDGRGGKES